MKTYELLLKTCPVWMLAVCAVAQPASLSRADREFLDTVATLDMTGAHEAELAVNQATRADVKDFAKMVGQDDRNSFGQLAEVAAKAGVSIPRGINTGRIPAVRQLEAMKGAGFDRQFSMDEMAAEQRAIAMFKREARYGKNGDVKNFASRMIPVVENDLKRAEECARTAKRG